MICTAYKESMKWFSQGRNAQFITPELWVPNYLNDGFYHRNSGSAIPEGWLSKFGWVNQKEAEYSSIKNHLKKERYFSFVVDVP